MQFRESNQTGVKTKLKLWVELLAEILCCATHVGQHWMTFPDDGSSDIQFFLKLDDVMLRIAVIQMSFALLCVITGGNSVCLHFVTR